MTIDIFLTQCYFDGHNHHEEGPYTIAAGSGIIRNVEKGDKTTGEFDPKAAEIHRCEFLMPGLVEAHSHLFLDGDELDSGKRKDYLSASWEQMAAVGRRNIGDSLAAGITLIRDGGDRHGINHYFRDASKGCTGLLPEIRSAGTAIRKEGRYGGFLGIAVKDADDAVSAIHKIAETADELKILLTGIIDFERGEVRGPVQFDLEEMTLMVETANRLGLKTFSHCSGLEGLQIAVKAGINSIEHGFFMNREILSAMADKQIAWVPTVSPVYFQFDRPELAGWNAQSVKGLDAILKNHFEHIALAFEMGVPIMAGSDAGSFGVPHGRALVDELFFYHHLGVPLEKILPCATSVPRTLWDCETADIVEGSRINLLELQGSPFVDMENLRKPESIFKNTDRRQIAG